jgi:dipeptidyl aminopeptidase/acylaminoacyl peptidase
MKRFFFILLFTVGRTLAAGASTVATAPVGPTAELPLSTFFQAPKLSALTFSPNGRYVACLVPYEHRTNLAVIDLESGKKTLLTNFKDKQATQPSWASDDRLLFRVDDEGKESFALHAVNRDGKDPTVLASGYSKADSNKELNVRFRSVLGRIEGDPKNILVLANLTYATWSDVAIMNLKTGAMTTLIEAPGNVEYYLRDHDGHVRIAVVDKDQVRRVLYRDAQEKSGWTTLGEHHMDSPGWEPIAFDGDNRTLFIWSDVGRKTRAIYRYDVGARKQLDLVFADDTYDALDANAASNTSGYVPNTIFDPSKKKIVGLSYAADRTRFVWFDDDMRKLHAKLEASLPDTVHRARQFNADGSKIIYLSSSDRDPGVYYLYDRTKQKLEELAVIKPGIDPEKMAAMKPVTFTARDGLLVHGYLTLPRGAPGRNLPLILHPHGGPFGIRDEWSYNDEVQYYANRGFAVLQIDYRGSGGYGREYEAAGFKKWGREMQNDLTDGVQWAVAQGIADPARVVISGASYGGYAAMAGVTLTPDLYCAGINYVGVTDITLLIPRGAAPSQMYWRDTRLGKLTDSADKKRLNETSPVNLADRIKVPLLMAYGKNDPRVHIDHGFDMERALKKAGKPYEMIIEEAEGHGFRMEEKRIQFFTRVDAFLKRNVPPAGSVKVGETQVVPDSRK